MGWGFEGPIGQNQRLVLYAISRCFRISSARRNVQRVSCKVCGAAIEPDHGHEVTANTILPHQRTACYFCAGCFDLVRAGHEAFPCFERPPEWWADLDRRPMTKAQLLEHRNASPETKEKIERDLHKAAAKVKAAAFQIGDRVEYIGKRNPHGYKEGSVYLGTAGAAYVVWDGEKLPTMMPARSIKRK